MSICFGDTSYFIALAVPGGENHAKALQWAQQSREPILTTEYVLLEIGNFLAPCRTRSLFKSIVAALSADRRVTIVPAVTELLEKGTDLYAARPDKSWSFTDCTSFVVMKERGIQDALTTDHHFQQAGFMVLLR